DNTHSEITKHELNKELDDLLSNLKPKDKEIFLKLYVQEKEIDIVSEEINLKKDVIYNRISRGKAKLRGLFQK
ncbi:MAG: sigma factor-like helix-turn-helix DNA-binding protein, partial [Romboutsia sp.]